MIGEKVRNLKGYGLMEGVSTRLLVYTARLIQSGLSERDACRAAISEALTDDPEMRDSVEEIINLFFCSESEDADNS